jgi:uncharacterized membrane protein
MILTDKMLLSIPEDIAAKVRAIARDTNQSAEAVLLAHLQTLAGSLALLPPDQQAELHALHALTDDALWAIAQAQLPAALQQRAEALMSRNNTEQLEQHEQQVLDALVERADRLMVRKAEAAAILRKRGYTFTQQDFKPDDE